MKRRRPNKVSKLFRAAAEEKALFPNKGCCDAMAVVQGDGAVFESANDLFWALFAPKPRSHGRHGFWWARPNDCCIDSDGLPIGDPDFEARMLALLLAELIAMEGGL